MAVNYYDFFGGVNINQTVKNPYYEFIDEQTAGLGDGTPIIADMAMESLSVFLALLNKQGTVLSNTSEVTVSSDSSERQFFLALEEFVRPTFTILVDYPDTVQHSVLYPDIIWSNVSSINHGGVWRVEGGKASPFESLIQEQRLPNLSGTIVTKSITYKTGGFSNGPFEAYQDFSGTWSAVAGSDEYKSIAMDMDASRQNPTYQGINDVAMQNRTIRLMMKIGYIL